MNDTAAVADLTNLTRLQLRKAYRGEFYKLNGPKFSFATAEFLGSVYLVDGLGWVLNVEDGKVISVVSGPHDPKLFKKVGTLQLSATQSVTNWTMLVAEGVAS